MSRNARQIDSMVGYNIEKNVKYFDVTIFGKSSNSYLDNYRDAVWPHS